MSDNKTYDVIIIGGSYAGLSAAMSLGRSLRSVLIIDSGLPCNRQTPHSHNFITQDGVRPAEIAAIAKAQVMAYKTVSFLNGLAIDATRNEKGFVIGTQDGQQFESKKLVLASGIKDHMPDIKGFAECWGISVVHCPYCHGYELRDRKTAIIAKGERAFHLASLVNNLTKDITILSNGKPDLSDEQISKLSRHNIQIIETEITAIDHQAGYVRNVVFADGTKIAFESVYAAVPFTQHSDVATKLGCSLTEQGHIVVDAACKTTVDGVYACGDNSSMMRSVANAVYTGNMTGAMINRELTEAQF
ncbi:MAG: NAD(P)/FAD-dependent oxidoreductase [Chryseolinea sp.]